MEKLFEMNARQKVLLNRVPLFGLGLEIGAGDRPLVPKDSGFNIETIDFLDSDDLRSKFRDAPYTNGETVSVDHVDFVWDGTKTYAQLTGKANHYDYVVSSNLIEHVPDIVSHLTQVGEILKSGGIYALAIPDMRHCIDLFRPWASVGRAIDAIGSRSHKRGAVVDFFLYHTSLDGRAAWPDSYYESRNYALTFSLDQRTKFFGQFENGEYLDIHNWVFTVSSFRLLIKELYSLGLIDLLEVEEPVVGFQTPEHYWEFYAFLHKDTTAARDLPASERLDLLQAIASETAHRFASTLTRPEFISSTDDLEILRTEIEAMKLQISELKANQGSHNWRFTKLYRELRAGLAHAIASNRPR